MVRTSTGVVGGVLKKLYLAEALLGKLLLLQLEDEGVELLLEPLVGVVDQQLLQRVGSEGLEPEDVQQPDKPLKIGAIREQVDVWVPREGKPEMQEEDKQTDNREKD